MRSPARGAVWQSGFMTNDLIDAKPRETFTSLAILVAPLAAIYSVSQFLRNAIGVIAPDLSRELGLSATQLGFLSSSFFLIFAAAQIPIGIFIDRYGPRFVMMVCSVLVVSGIIGFALAPDAQWLMLARMVTGLGCASLFMAPLAIYARRFPPERFAALTGLQLGAGSIGTLLATAPLAMAAAGIGWRATFLFVAGASALAALAVYLLIEKDKPSAARETWGEALVGVREAIGVPHFWPVFAMHATGYAAFATIIGLWAGPWLSDVMGFDLSERGQALLLGALAQIAALLAAGRFAGLVGGIAAGARYGALASIAVLLVGASVSLGPVLSVAWLVLFGAVIAYSPLVTAHGKALFPTRLTGRGITLMNLGTMGGVFVIQSLSGTLMDAVGRLADGTYPEAAYRATFAALAALIALALAFYWRVGEPVEASNLSSAQNAGEPA